MLHLVGLEKGVLLPSKRALDYVHSLQAKTRTLGIEW